MAPCNCSKLQCFYSAMSATTDEEPAVFFYSFVLTALTAVTVTSSLVWNLTCHPHWSLECPMTWARVLLLLLLLLLCFVLFSFCITLSSKPRYLFKPWQLVVIFAVNKIPSLTFSLPSDSQCVGVGCVYGAGQVINSLSSYRFCYSFEIRLDLVTLVSAFGLLLMNPID